MCVDALELRDVLWSEGYCFPSYSVSYSGLLKISPTCSSHICVLQCMRSSPFHLSAWTIMEGERRGVLLPRRRLARHQPRRQGPDQEASEEDCEGPSAPGRTMHTRVAV